MQLELKRIQHELRTTFVYVTHDQEEALSMSDRIAVMKDGVVEQLGSPRDVYEHPATPFVADFVGVLNALAFRVDETSGTDAVMRVSERDRVVVPGGGSVAPGSELLVAVRPERIRVHLGDVATNGGSRVTGRIDDVIYLGTLTQFHIATDAGARIVAHRLSDEDTAGIGHGQVVTLTWDREDASILHEG
jgi:spermidine/putrescine transport system ATP-binding protein